jgi:hypothetical protein
MTVQQLTTLRSSLAARKRWQPQTLAELPSFTTHDLLRPGLPEELIGLRG